MSLIACKDRSRFLLDFVPSNKIVGVTLKSLIWGCIFGFTGLYTTVILWAKEGIITINCCFVNSDITVIFFTKSAGSQNQNSLTYILFIKDPVKAESTSCTVSIARFL